MGSVPRAGGLSPTRSLRAAQTGPPHRVRAPGAVSSGATGGAWRQKDCRMPVTYSQEETGLSDYEQIYRAQVLCLRKVNGLQNISERDVCSAI